MSSARTIIGNYCPRKSNLYILNKCKLQDARNLIMFSCMNLYYTMFHTEIPEALINLYLSQNRRAKIHNLSPKDKVKNTKKTGKSFIYNEIPKYIKLLTKEKFAFKIKVYLYDNTVWDSCY